MSADPTRAGEDGEAAGTNAHSVARTEKAGVRCDGFYARSVQFVLSILDRYARKRVRRDRDRAHVHWAFAVCLSPSHTGVIGAANCRCWSRMMGAPRVSIRFADLV